MTTYLLDTSVIVEFLNGNEKIRKYLDGLQGELTTSWVCVAEIFEGVKLGFKPKLAEQKLSEFLDGLAQVWGVDLETAKRFGEVRASLRQSGTMIEDLDILISGTCVANNLTLVTLNMKHFERVKGLQIENGVL